MYVTANPGRKQVISSVGLIFPLHALQCMKKTTMNKKAKIAVKLFLSGP
jgi:hypothetical protein